MILGLLSFHIKSAEITCRSELKHADPISGYKLAWLGVVTRHGIRTPMDSWTPKDVSGTWNCDNSEASAPRMHVSPYNGFRRRFQRVIDPKYAPFTPNCEAGELTVEGMEMHYELGNFYRKWLVNETQFLPPYFDKDQVSVRSSKVERCLRSAVSFLNGFYPPAKPGEHIQIITGSDYREFLYPAASGCADLQKVWDDFTATQVFKDRMARSKALYDNIYKAINLTADDTNWMFIGDWISSYMCSDQEIPIVKFTEEQTVQALKDIAYFSYGFFGTNRAVAASPIWRHIFADIDDFIAKKPSSTKFRLYSAHDTTIAALLTSLGFTDDKLPPFRSHLDLELWQKGSKYLFRVVFNGIPMGVDFMKNENANNYAAFKQALAKRGDLKWCLQEYPTN
ncbi:Histidine acid phosphatase family protein [Trichomonas vaginalis G3]|uniref:Histidine acid phosphatase family protein n=1 Tax=Trichomonas vaginalis (strain ATCC PRA-98 / G3) TaxID=412133 RepID=A2DHY1_TRIV3|nr:histidine acid phosphatase [Trichomonas vaginalis G3]EAY19970.1 Histidine acid phosphatase family protein [Trichomonas vaginalis G3]KAI5525920.1 acid phosphatase protein [Trichomonas vaginalis G3]|eukprot:XP_001580956.1 histidine acid phosphatase [Trichomonas vaginalis G3]